MNLHLEIITLEKVIYTNEVDEVIVPTTSGQITILPKHISLLSRIAPGELTIKKNGSTEFLAITGGFLEVEGNNVNILADYAIRSEDVEIEKSRQAQQTAEKLMKEKISDEDFATAQAQFSKAVLELKIAHKRKRRNL